MSTRLEERLGAGLGLVVLAGLAGFLIYAASVDRAAIQELVDAETSDPAIEQQLEALQSLSALLRDTAAICGDVENTAPCALPILPQEGNTQ